MSDTYGLDEPVAPLPPRASTSSAQGVEASAAGRPLRTSANRASKSKKKDSGGSTATKTLGGVLAAIIVIAGIGLRVNRAYQRFNQRNQAPTRVFPAGAAPAGAVPAALANRDGPIAVPALPDPGPGREIEPGITLHEIRLPGGPQPGWSGKLWLYLPTGAKEPRSLPCVMIAGAGSNLLTGMDLGDGDRPEHLPYVHAGFAVLAYELDGALGPNRSPTDLQMGQAILKFLAARAGLVNAHVALEFLLAKVPQVDPGKIYAVGHSSAGTLAMLFAENEPRIRGCVAYAPAIDLEKRFGPQAITQFERGGFVDLAVRYSPKNNEAKLSCPILLFHARDDSNIPVADTEACAERLKQLGKAVTLEIVPTGNHYNSMIQQGIPTGIAWLQGLGS
jgi:dienelactone hydrolase